MKYSDAIFKNFISLFISSTRKMWLGDADMKAHDNVRTAHWHYLSCSPKLSSCCCCLVAKSCPTPCDPMTCSRPGFPGLHYLLKFAQTHIHWVSDDIQPSHPLLYPFPLAFNLSWHQGLFKWVLCIRWPKYWNFRFSISLSNEYSGLISFRMDGWISLQSKVLSRVFSNTKVQKHQFFSAQLSS